MVRSYFTHDSPILNNPQNFTPSVQGLSAGHFTDHTPTGDSQLESAANVVQPLLPRNISESQTESEGVEKAPPTIKVMHDVFFLAF